MSMDLHGEPFITCFQLPLHLKPYFGATKMTGITPKMIKYMNCLRATVVNNCSYFIGGLGRFKEQFGCFRRILYLWCKD